MRRPWTSAAECSSGQVTVCYELAAILTAMRRLLLLLAVVAAGLASTTAPAAPEPELKIIFPEGWSAGQMADRAAEVRQIAIRKRGVTPRLSGASYAAATRAAKAPASFRPFLKRRSVEGFLFPSTYFFQPSSSAGEPRRDGRSRRSSSAWASIDLRAAKARKQTPYDVLIIASLIEKETVAPERARARCRGDLQPARARHAAGDRRVAALRPRCRGHAAAQAVAPPEQHAVQHAPLQGSAADADHESRPAVDACGREAREGRLPLLRPQAEQRAPLLHGRRSTSSARRPSSTATRAVNAGLLRGAERRRPPSRGRCARLRRPCRAGRRPARPARA